jgi:hypothetical protein
LGAKERNAFIGGNPKYLHLRHLWKSCRSLLSAAKKKTTLQCAFVSLFFNTIAQHFGACLILEGKVIVGCKKNLNRCKKDPIGDLRNAPSDMSYTAYWQPQSTPVSGGQSKTG